MSRLTNFFVRKIGAVITRIFNFVLPNIFSKTHVNILGNVLYNQKTYFRGLGKIDIQGDCMFGYKPGGFHNGAGVELQARYKESYIQIGKSLSTNNNIFVCSANRIVIGEHVLIGQNVTIMDFEAHGIKPENRGKLGEVGEIIIQNNVWIGNNVIILKNSFIGKNSVVAAGAVVSGHFPENVLIGGVPAKIIKQIA